MSHPSAVHSSSVQSQAGIPSNEEVIELLSSDDEDSCGRGNKSCMKRSTLSASPATFASPILLLSSDDDEEEEESSEPSSFQRNTRSMTRAGLEDRKPAAKVCRKSEIDLTHNEICNESSDVAFVRQLQAEEDVFTPPTLTKKQKAKQERNDARFAARLQSKEEKHQVKRKQEEMDLMKASKAGRSVLLVDRVIQLVARLNQGETHGQELEPVGKDDAVYLCEKMLECQEGFEAAGVPVHVCLGYHYTRGANLDAIRTDGLLTVEDRIAANSKNKQNRAFFGNGIYVGTNPHAFRSYGDTGLLVAILKGNELNVGRRSSPPLPAGINTVVGNKINVSPYGDEVILKTSAQVLPLVKFPQARISEKAFADLVWSLHQQIQHEAIDEYFNNATKTTIERVAPLLRTTAMPVLSAGGQPGAPTAFTVGSSFSFTLPFGASGVASGMPFSFTPGPSSSHSSHLRAFPSSLSSSSAFRATGIDITVYSAPSKLLRSADISLMAAPAVGSCSICMCALDATAVKLPCQHAFHKACIKSSMKHSTECPDCRTNISDKVQGTSPSGTMLVTFNPATDVSGYVGVGTITIVYTMKSGIQKIYHPNPGVAYHSASRAAYLPNNQQGQDLLKRLKWAFIHGLMFTVGTSLTTQQPNTIVWASIHVKTSPQGGVHGWPDPNYFQNVDSELNGLGVPPDSSL